MQLNVSFEVCAIIMLTIFTFFAQTGNPRKNKGNSAYIALSVCIILTCSADVVLSMLSNRYNSAIPPLPAYTVRILFYIFSMTCGSLFIRYLHIITSDGKKNYPVFLISLIPQIAFSVFAVLTPWTKLLFYIDENNIFHQGKLFILADAVILFYTLTDLTFLIIKRKHFTPLRFMSGAVFTLSAILGLSVQRYLMPDTCIGFSAAAIAVMMIYFTTQCPEPYNMIRTLDELNKAKAEAEDASKAKEDFLRHISHEMRTPVNSMLGMNSMILRKSFDEEITQYAETAEKSGKILLHLIDNILDYTQLSSGNITLNNSDYSPKKLFEELISKAIMFTEDKDIRFVSEISENIPSLLSGDLPRVRQIIENLLSNAVKFTDKGQIKLSAEHMPAGAEHIRMIITVSDTGCGIRSEDLKKMSDSFIRFDEGNNADIEGAGLGLSVTGLILKLMHGRLYAESEYGKGSTFTIEFLQKTADPTPMGTVTAHSVRNHTEQYSFTAHDADVLITDDSTVNLFVLHEFLKQFGISADIAGSGEECFELATKKYYDVIFLDHMMPEPDGIKTMKMIKNTSGCSSSGSAIIAVTANAVTGAKEQYIAEGFTDYMSKPIDFDILSELLLKYIPGSKIIHHEHTPYSFTETEIFSAEKLSHINTAAGLSLYNENRSGYANALENFAETAGDFADRLRQAAENEDMPSYANASAEIRNTAFNIGAENLSDMAAFTEKLAISEKKNDVLMLHYDFIGALERVAEISSEISTKIHTEQ